MSNNQYINIVLFNPEIPGNTGSIGRTCLALGARLILIKPYGFDLSEKAVRRAGLDYWKYVDIVEYNSFNEFIRNEFVSEDQLFLFENHQGQNYFDVPSKNMSEVSSKNKSYLVFGSETKGISSEICKTYSSRIFHLPMFSNKIRSLNLSNAATAVAYETLRKLSS